MRRITRIIAGVGVLVAGMTVAAWAHDFFVDEDGDGISDVAARGHSMKGRIGGPFGLNLKNITLTADQQTQADKLGADHQTAVTALVTTLQARETELRTLKTAATPDQTAINAKIEEINAVRSQIQQADSSYRTSVLNLLTPEQRGALDAQKLGLARAGITLTTDQLTQIDKLTTNHQTAAATLQTGLQARQAELRDLMKATTPDQTAINAKIDEVNSALSQLQKENAAYAIAVRGVLTAEQLAALPAQGVGVGAGPGPGRGHGRGGHGRR
jgi:Spy/CpxP family protein refolding chaperone